MKKYMRAGFQYLFGTLLMGLLWSGCSTSTGTTSNNNNGGGSNIPRTFQFGELQGISATDPNGFLQRTANGTNTTALLGGFTSLGLQNPTRAALGGKIVFERNKINDFNLFAINPDGSALTQITNNDSPPQGRPHISSDGTKVVYQFGNNLYTAKADGTVQTLLVNNGANPKWSADGTKVVFNRFTANGSHIFTIKADGTGETQVTTTGNNNFEPSWFPNGQKLIFVSNRNSAGNLYTINADGTSEARLTTNVFEEHYPTVSPNGNAIAFYRFSTTTPKGVYKMNTDGSNTTLVLENASTPAWSPDNAKLLVSYVQTNAQGIFLVNTDGTGVTRLTTTPGPGNDGFPSWGAPPVSNRTLVGTNGVMGGTATGFLYGSTGGSDGRAPGTPRSFLTITSEGLPTFFNTSLPFDQNGGTNIGYRIEAINSSTSISGVQYWNFSQNAPTVVNSVETINGILVTYDTTNGEVSTVAPYKITRGATPTGAKSDTGATLKGNFIGVWNSKGKNVAPQGATEIHLDSTGRLLSIY
jgi:Tol biopolymer transport system component